MSKKFKSSFDLQYGDYIGFNISAVRTLKTDDDTGTHACAADTEVISKKPTEKFSLIYTIELLDDKKGIYVTLVNANMHHNSYR